MPTPAPLVVDARDAALLRRRLDDDPDTSAARRARIVLLCAEGRGPSAVADLVGCSRQTVITWRERYREQGAAGLLDAPRPGRPTHVDAAAVVARTLQGPPPGRSRWSTRSLAGELGISNVAVANVWRSWGISPLAGGRVRLDTRPAVTRPVDGIVALHVDSALRLLAIRTATAPAPNGPGTGGGGIGNRLDRHVGAAAVDPAGFLERLAVPAVAGDRGLGLVVEAGTTLPPSLTGRPGVGVHEVPPPLCWMQVARVLCVLGAGSTGGATSVRRLRRYLDRLAAGQAVSWIDGAPG